MKTARSHYSEMLTDRSPVLEKARVASDLTIPGLIPRDGQNDSTLLSQPHQSLGAQGVNNLASKVMLSLFPPGMPFLRHEVSPAIMASAPNGDAVANVRTQLASVESDASRIAERERGSLWMVMLHLLVAGTTVFYHPRGTDARVYGLHQFTLRRNPAGRARLLVIKEEAFVADLEDEVKTKAGVSPKAKTVEVYTVVQWSKDRCEWWQEINDKRVTDVMWSKPEVSPWIVAQWKPRAGKHYAESHVMEILGDLMTYESMTAAVTQFAEIASKVIFLDNPNSTTDIEELRTAQTGDFVQGSLEDIGVLQVQKYADFQVVNAVMQRIEKRLGTAFMLHASAVREAERVTAEEIRVIAQELEDALGGVYSILAAEFQRPYAERLLHEMRQDGRAPQLPPNSVEVTVVTGFDALGRAHSTGRLRQFVADARGLFGDDVLRYMRIGDALNRLGTGHGVEDLSKLLMTDAEVSANDEQAQLNSALQSAAPGVMDQVVQAGLQEE